MQRIALTLSLVVWAATCQAIGNGRITPEMRLCFTQLPVLASVSESPKLSKRYPPLSLPVSDHPYGTARPAEYAARFYPSETPRDTGFTPLRFTVADYEARLRKFAEETVDHRSITYVSDLPDGTRIKLHLLTGELLIMNRRGEVALYTKLPVGLRSVAALNNTAEVFGLLVGKEETKARYPHEPQTFARLSAGEAIKYEDFPSSRALYDHVDKHVLVLNAERRTNSVRQKADYVASRRVELAMEFADLRRPFLAAVEACDGDVGCEQAAYDALAISYERRVINYLSSRKPSILTYSQFQDEDRGGYSVTQVTGFRFDVLTNEMAVINRVTGHVLTYFRLDLTTGNRWLATHGYAPANSPFEYFLALISCHRSHPTRQLAAQNCHPSPVLVP